MSVGAIFSPEISSQILTEITQVSYLIRNVARISGEHLGLPQSIPDERKADYLYRDYFFVPIIYATSQVGGRLAESRYVMPTQIKLLEFNRLSKIYTADNIHTPKLPAFFQIKNYEREMPSYIRDYLLGTTVNGQGRSYQITPELLHTKVIPEMMQRCSPNEIHEARLLAHHIQRIFNPTDYINRFLLKENRITIKEASTLREFNNLIEKAYSAFITASETKKYEQLQKFLAPHIRSENFQKNTWLKQWFNPEVNKIETKLAGPTMKQFLKVIHRAGFKNGFAWLKKQTSIRPDNFMLDLHHHLLNPLMNSAMPRNTKMTDLLKDLVHNKIRATQALTAFESSATWCKIAISLALSTIAYGIIGSYFDVKYVQPMQDLVVKLRGDSTELQAPTYIGTVVGGIAAYFAHKAPFVKRTGHLPSFLITLAAIEAGQIGTVYAMFKRILARPPQNKGKYRVVRTNNPFHQQQLKANTTPFSTQS